MSKARESRIASMIARTPFGTARDSLTGVKGATYGYGRMEIDERNSYDAVRDTVVFTILSYATPIAWVLEDGTVHVTERSYSPTTASRHLPEVRAAYNVPKPARKR